ncbi:MAG: hypothetical protein Kow00117_02370 [Phototrophicales bacterium]
MMILVVEDDQAIGDVIQIYLRQLGLQHHLCINGKEALNFIKQNPPDLILLDIGLPQMNGWSLLDHMHSMNINPPVIILTAYGDVETQRLARERGIEVFLKKPVSLTELQTAIQHMLSLH